MSILILDKWQIQCIQCISTWTFSGHSQYSLSCWLNCLHGPPRPFCPILQCQLHVHIISASCDECVVCVRERAIASAHTQPFLLTHTHTAVTHTHGSSESVARAASPEALAQLLSRMMGGVCLCVGLLSLVSGLNACFLFPHLHVCACVSSALPSSCPSIPAFLYLSLFLCFPSQRLKAVVGPGGVRFGSPAAASSPHGPCKTRLLLPRGPQASAALPPNKFAVTLSAIGP